MEEPSIFDNISPLDHRYYLANRELFERLRSYLSESASIEYCKRAELALLRCHIELHLENDLDLLQAVEAAHDALTAAEVYEEEERTQHNVRALVHVIKRHLPPRLAPFVHLGATSVDILDTAFSMRIRDAVRNVILPLLIDLEALLIRRAREEIETSQVGRTHGQHAVPITFGFALSEYVARFGASIREIDVRSRDLRGKLSGAVGAYNATSFVSGDPAALERRYLEQLGLSPSEIATQMVIPEYLLRLLLEINISFGIAANLADDLRHLQRSEIDEVREFFGEAQVGSSTMPQKRNPWNSEHVKSLWKAYSPRVMTFFMDQISEHQRDLSNSASSRFVVEYLTGFAAAIERLRRIVGGLAINRKRMLETLASCGGGILAEPSYILLALAGDLDAHEEIRRITLDAESANIPFDQALRKRTDVWETISKQLSRIGGPPVDEFFAHPELYRGIAIEKTTEITDRYQEMLDSIREGLE